MRDLMSIARYITLTVLLFIAAVTVQAQLPPAAQEALDNGIIAAKVPDYVLAIRYFEEARKIAPNAPIIYFNLGLAESNLPSRELRAICWFAAYLAAEPKSPNAASVKERIQILKIKNQSNVSHLIQTMQDAAQQGNAAALRDAAHTLKGSSSSLGAERLVHYCLLLEIDAKKGIVARAVQLVEKIEYEYDSVVARLQEELKSLGRTT